MAENLGARARTPVIVGRYAIYEPIAAGGMATVHLGRLLGPRGFSRTVAVKKLHKQFASEPAFVSMLLDEARIAGRIRHPNVVPTLDIVADGDELFLVMEYVAGESLARLSRVASSGGGRMPIGIVSAVVTGLLHGLHAAHEATDENGAPLNVVHRDVSPQNILVATDGLARLLDFGVAKAANQVHVTIEGTLKGKLAYMAPEQLAGKEPTRQADVYSAGVLLWELVTGERLFRADNEGALIAKILGGQVERPSLVLSRRGTAEPLPKLEALDAVVMRALHLDPNARFSTAHEMAAALERALKPATTREVSEWVWSVAGDVLEARARMVSEIESSGPRPRESAGPFPAAASSAPSAPSAPAASFAPTGASPPLLQPAPTSPPPAPSRRSFYVGVAVVGGLLGLLLMILGVALSVREHAPKGSDRAARQASASAAPSATEQPLASAPPPASAQPHAADSSSPPVASSVASPRLPPRPRNGTSGGTGGGTSANCSPPYWFDDQGTKHYKTNCPLN